MEEHVHVSHCLVPFFFGLGELVKSPAPWNLARRWRLRIACFCPVLLPCHISCIQDSSQDHWTLIREFDIIQNECLGERTQILPLFFFFYSELLYLSQNTALVHFLSVMKKLPSFESLSISWQLVWNYVIATYRNELLIKSPAERIAISVLETDLLSDPLGFIMVSKRFMSKPPTEMYYTEVENTFTRLKFKIIP